MDCADGAHDGMLILGADRFGDLFFLNFNRLTTHVYHHRHRIDLVCCFNHHHPTMNTQINDGGPAFPTPRTDAKIKDHPDDVGWCFDDFEGIVDARFARELERENIELRRELEQAHSVLDNDPSQIIRNAKDGYPEGQEPSELTLEERVQALARYAADYKEWFNESEKKASELRQALSGRTVSCSQCNDAAAKMAEMREAIKCADEALEADGYDLENKARAKLQPFTTACSTESS